MNKRAAFAGFLIMTLALMTCLQGDAARAQERVQEQEILKQIAQVATQFSAAYMQGDIAKLVSYYTDDAVIFPGNSDLIRGKEAIKKYWTLPPGRVVTHHKITALEIKLLGEFAYDYGYYEVQGRNGEEPWGPTYGKYLIVWQRDQSGAWKMHLDMWNSRPKPEGSR